MFWHLKDELLVCPYWQKWQASSPQEPTVRLTNDDRNLVCSSLSLGLFKCSKLKNMNFITQKPSCSNKILFKLNRNLGLHGDQYQLTSPHNSAENILQTGKTSQCQIHIPAEGEKDVIRYETLLMLERVTGWHWMCLWHSQQSWGLLSVEQILSVMALSSPWQQENK